MRVAAVADFAALRRCLEESCEAKLRLPRAGTRTHVRASGVPVALLCSLHLVALALNPSLLVVSQQVVRTTYDSLVVDLLVEGPALVGDEWRLAGLGFRPVVVKRMASRRRPAPSAAMLALTPSTRVPAPSRPLSGGERSSWANVVRLGECLPRGCNFSPDGSLLFCFGCYCRRRRCYPFCSSHNFNYSRGSPCRACSPYPR